MRPNFIKSNEKKQILAELEKLYGIQELPHLLLHAGRERIRAYSGNLSKEEIEEITELTNIENIGMYFFSARDEHLRINFDAVSLLKDLITKNIIEINKEQFDLWIRGQDLELSCQKGPVIIKYQNDLVGLGKSNGERIFNYIPKERALKTPLKSFNNYSS